jgi:protein-tyrosine kinase
VPDPKDEDLETAFDSAGTGVIGDVLVTEGALSAAEVERVVSAQRREGMRFGEAAVHLGLLKNTDVRRALARQYEYPYIKNSEVSPLDRRIFAAYEPFQPRAESLRTLRSQLTMCWFSGERRALSVISPERGGWSSFVAANLAVTFAQLGERTLLIDANLRSPMQHKLFGLEDTEGLSSVLGGRASFKSALQRVTPFDRLWVLGAGALVPNPQELLARDAFSNLMQVLATKFRAIIIDTPPALDSADAQIVAARAGGCLIVARRHQTRVRDLRRISQMLAPSGAQVLGVMISD